MLNAKQEKEFQEMVEESVELMEQEKIAKAFIEAEDVAGQSEPQVKQRVKTAPGIEGEVKRFGCFREEFNGVPFTENIPKLQVIPTDADVSEGWNRLRDLPKGHPTIHPKKEPRSEAVNKPSHYHFFGIDTMPMLEKILGTEGYLGFLQGNALKYRLRVGKKAGNSIEQDVAKAMYYEDLYNDFVNENTPS